MTTGAPEVVVVIPVGGIDPHLAAQLDAVLSQSTTFDFEVVLSVNSSDASVVDFVARAAAATNDTRVRTIDASAKRSASFARNRGAAASTAPVIAFCDADDEVAPSWLQSLVRDVDANHATGGMLSETRFAIPRQEKWRPPATPGALPSFLGAPYLVTANMAITRDVFERVGGFDDTLVRSEDVAFGWALARAGVSLVWVPEAVVHYRHRRGVMALLRQHYLYGIGMSQVLKRHGLPDGAAGRVPRGVALLRPNGQPAPRSIMTIMRRGSLAVGRVVGLLHERSDRSSRSSVVAP
jgi:glycosyltransferase involved in cell wall biosynthesis